MIMSSMMFSFSHLTCLVQLLYLGKVSRPELREFSLKLLIPDATILGYLMQNCRYIILLT